MKVQLFHRIYQCLLLILFALTPNCLLSQKISSSGKPKFISLNPDIFNTNCFIKNSGQYDLIAKSLGINKIEFGYMGMKTPVLFTAAGIIYVINRRKNISHEEVEKAEKNGIDLIKNSTETNYIKMKWLGANPDATVIPEDQMVAYHSYGTFKANSYRKITVHNIYRQIDIVYTISKDGKRGYEYSFVINPGGNVDDIRMQFEGDMKTFAKALNGGITISYPGGYIKHSLPACYDSETHRSIKSSFKILKNQVSISVPPGYDHHHTLIIDPFVSSDSNLTGLNANIAKDVDFDYAGNVYVSGGGSDTIHQLAKFDENGVLQWTFDGWIYAEGWKFGEDYGGWVVDKSTGNIYLGQGFFQGRPGASGTRTVRLNTNGIYDNFITDFNAQIRENWKMAFSCNGTNGQIFLGGGSTVSNLNFAIISPPQTIVSYQNITGIPYIYMPPPLFPTGDAQDIADFIIDPLTKDMYSIFPNVLQPTIDNHILKHQYPYMPVDQLWVVPTGFTPLDEANNRPYLFGVGSANGNSYNQDNSANLLALNSNFLFYWDGKNLKAFDKGSGAAVGNVITFPANLALYEGGIVADECNNVYIGFRGMIKVFHFTPATGFDDSPPDIPIPGFPGSDIYDLAYDDSRGLIYAAGNGFVGSFDVSSNCVSTLYSETIVSDCITETATATIAPVPTVPVTYNLYVGPQYISGNSTGTFNNLVNGLPYTIVATVNEACGGPQARANFTLGTPIGLTITKTNATCGINNGSINAVGSLGTPPYRYSIDYGITFQRVGLFNNLPPGNYIVLVQDASPCGAASMRTVILQKSAPGISPIIRHATCGTNNGSITINTIGGTPPFQYTKDGVTFQNSNLFSNLAAGSYSIAVKDSNNCRRDTVIQISSGCLSSTLTPTPASCFADDGAINAQGLNGISPYNYSIDGINFQSAGMFSNLAAGTYTITVRDATNLTFAQLIIVSLNNSITLSVPHNLTKCEGKSISIPGSSNATSIVWTPSTGLSNSSISNPTISIDTTIKYLITATTANCTRTDSVTVLVNMAPIAVASIDSTICFGKSIQLNGSGGIVYLWTPPSSLSDPLLSNPVVIKPLHNITYSLKVTDANGCSSLNNARTKITVTSRVIIFAGNDTAIAMNQPLQLNVMDLNNSGLVNFLWSPSYGLNNNTIRNPVAKINQQVSYVVTASTAGNCIASDTINVKVYKGPAIYVPNAFTPNGDGLNDVLSALPIGMKSFSYFKVYNRWGQLVFSTSDASKGWDGSFKGAPQPIGSFIWLAEAVDFRGNPYQAKGVVMLVR